LKKMGVAVLVFCLVFGVSAIGLAESINIPKEKNPGIAALASLVFTGGGQIYNGQIGKGFAIMGGQVLLVSITYSSLIASVENDNPSLSTVGLVSGVGSLVLSGWSIYDAYSSAEKINAKAAARYINAYIDETDVGLSLTLKF